MKRMYLSLNTATTSCMWAWMRSIARTNLIQRHDNAARRNFNSPWSIMHRRCLKMHDHVARTDTLILLVLALAILAAPGCAKLENITLGSYVVSFNVDESLVGNYEIIEYDPYKKDIIPSPDSENSYLLTSYSADIVNDTTNGVIEVRELNDVQVPINWTNYLADLANGISYTLNARYHERRTWVTPGYINRNNTSTDISIIWDEGPTILEIIAIYPLSDGEPKVCSIISTPPEWAGICKTVLFEKVNSTDEYNFSDLQLPKEHPGPDDPGYMVFPTGTYTYLLYWTGEIYRYPMVEAFETFGVSPDATPIPIIKSSSRSFQGQFNTK